MTPANALNAFQPPVRQWFREAFGRPTPAQERGWPPIVEGRSTLLVAPTGSGKTLAAFLAAVDRLTFSPPPSGKRGCRVLYVSPLKALAVDVERNLRAPIAGIVGAAQREGRAARAPSVAIRTGDTPPAERARMLRHPPDVLVTTPESLYLLLTSSGRDLLSTVETVIVDEIHSLVPSKRGAHLALSLERLEDLREDRERPLQRIGLSATQRPLEEAARFLGGGTLGRGKVPRWIPRPVEIVDAGARKPLDLRVEVPVEDMTRLGDDEAIRSGPAAGPAPLPSLWPSIYPRIVELIREHRSTMVFVNSRRLAERLAGALNEVAGEEIALAHHGSVARDKRAEIEDRLKRGALPAIVATSSLELGIDMGAVDLVIQVEAPPSVASGLQRVGRGGHSVGAVSRGVIFPKYRGDLLACAAATERMKAGAVEETRAPKNPLDVLAQQVVAIVSSATETDADALHATVRRAAPFSDLPRSAFDGVLDMLSGRYPSDDFAGLRPRVTWDRVRGTLRPREGSRRTAIVNGGTIPDRGLYGVFLAGAEEGRSRRVGELDEEMVFESRTGDVFLLGASSWRIEEINHDRVVVSPAPGEPGKMPFWHGDRLGRPPEYGRAVGALARTLVEDGPAAATKRLREEHGLDARAAKNLLAYLREQAEATGEVPSDKTVVVERCVDDLGDWRVCVLSPFGARVHAPWATAVVERWRRERAGEIDTMWSDDGIVFRLPESEEPPPLEAFVPRSDDVEDLVTRGLPQTALFAARFRENAARALLLPRRHPGGRSPLFAQRKRAADLLAVTARYGSFPILLETYRECLRDVFDLPGLVDLLRRVESRRLRVTVADTRTPSPFAAAILFSYVASFIYDGDAPLAERRAQALSVDTAQLRELLGEADLRELLDSDAMAEIERSLQRLDPHRPVRHADGLHDLLLALGDLTEEEVASRCDPPSAARGWLGALASERRAFPAPIAGERRWVAAEDAGRMRDALGIVPPRGLPQAFLEPARDALRDVVSRYARTHGPFRVDDVASRFGIGPSAARAALERLAADGRVVEGEFLPGGRDREWCDADVLRTIKRRSLARLRKQVEPVEPAAFGRFLVEWQGVGRRLRGQDALLSALERLEGCPVPASVLEDEVLPSRVEGFRPADLDSLCAAGEVVWAGLEPIGPSDGRIALYTAESARLLLPDPREVEGDLARAVRDLLASRGASFFSDLVAETGAFPRDLLEALWDLVWAGVVTNDTLAPVRARLRGSGTRRDRAAPRPRVLRPRRSAPPGSEGRWSLLSVARATARAPSPTERRAALARALLERHGVLTREAVHSEGVPGGFSAVYEVLKAMEEAGRVRRGHFVAGLGATQFAVPGAEDRLRSLREPPEDPEAVVLAATDPGNPYGAALAWPPREGARPQRAAGAKVVIVDGALRAYFGRAERDLWTFLPAEEPDRARAARAVAGALAGLVDEGGRRAVLLSKVDGEDPARSALAAHLAAEGFTEGGRGFLRRAIAPA